MIFIDQSQPLPIGAPALAPLLLDLLEQKHVRPVAPDVPFRILLQLCIDLLQILVPIATLLGRSLSCAEPVQHLGDHFPNTRMILAIRLERALNSLRLDDVQESHRLWYIEIAFGCARRSLMMIATRDSRRGILCLLQDRHRERERERA